MRFWPARTARVDARAEALPCALRERVEEGYLVAVSALRLAVKNAIIMRILRDGEPWSESVALDFARDAIDALIVEQQESSTRLAEESVRVRPSSREVRSARSRSERARVRRKREDADRMATRSRTVQGVVTKLQEARSDEAFLLDLALRAREETMGELMQARLMPEDEHLNQTDEERREAIAGVISDLQQLMEERASFSAGAPNDR